MSEADGIHDPSYRKGQHDTLEWLREKLGEPNLPTLTACGKRIADLRARLAEVEAERDRYARENRRLREACEEAVWVSDRLRTDAKGRQSDYLKAADGTAIRATMDKARAALAPAAVEQDGAREGQEQP